MDTTAAIRLATIEDAGTIHAGLLLIGDHLGARHKVVSTPEDLARHGFGQRPAFTVLIAETGGVFSGLCLFFDSFSTWRGVPGAYIQDIVVDPAFRGTGVGEALLRATAAHVRAAGGRYLRLSVDAENPSAQRFYERQGLAPSGGERIHAAYGEAFERLAGQHESGV